MMMMMMMGGEAGPGSGGVDSSSGGGSSSRPTTAAASTGMDQHHMIDLNVGGRIFTTTTRTLTALSMAGNSGRITSIGSHAAAFLSSSSARMHNLLWSILDHVVAVGVAKLVAMSTLESISQSSRQS